MLALLYDVHGNLPALEAVLADARAQGAERFLLGGDYALFGAWPEATLERLEDLGGEWIRGNGERWSAAPDEAPEVVRPAIAALREALGEERVAALAMLPEALVRDGARYCHASPISDVRGFAAAPDPEDVELLGDAAERRVVIGHTHLQFVRSGPGGVEIVNPGSVGMPLDGDHRAAYALVAPDGTILMRRAAYDHAASAAAVRERLGAAGEPAARRIERARFEVDD